MGKHSAEKRKQKEKQRQIDQLQKELGVEIIEILKAANTPLDINQIVEHYPQNARRKESDDKTLKLYMSMGLGPLIQEGKVKELPQAEDGRYPLALAE